MSVTPQINDDGRVTLTVRPTISDCWVRISRIRTRSAFRARRCLANNVPVMQVREMESVLQVANGQTIILGGLMEDRTRFNRDQLPVVGDVPTVGDAFRFRDERASKTELIIFLRPTVIDERTPRKRRAEVLPAFPAAARAVTSIRRSALPPMSLLSKRSNRPRRTVRPDASSLRNRGRAGRRPSAEPSSRRAAAPPPRTGNPRWSPRHRREARRRSNAPRGPVQPRRGRLHHRRRGCRPQRPPSSVGRATAPRPPHSPSCRRATRSNSAPAPRP